MKIAVVTDSTSDISAEEAAMLGIRMVPAILVINGEQYLDGKGMSREEFYEMLPRQYPPPTTASPSSGMFSETYQELFASGYEAIFSIHVASTLSGMVNTARAAAAKFGECIRVIDSGQLTLGLGFQVMEAAKAAVGGSIQQVQDAIESVQQRLNTIAMLDTLEQLKRSGRVSWLRSSLGSLLQTKLFLEVKEGTVHRLGETRTRGKGIERLSEMLTGMGPLEQLAIVHTNALQEATDLAEKFASQVSSPPLVRNVTTVIGTHVGVRGLGFISVRANSN